MMDYKSTTPPLFLVDGYQAYLPDIQIKSSENLVDKYNKGHVWIMGWEESNTLHPGFNTYGSYVDQCEKCGMYGYEFSGFRNENKNFVGQPCGDKIR